MERMIILLFVLAVVNSVQNQVDKEKWRSYAMDLSNDTRMQIRAWYHKKNSFCSDLREHAVSFQEKELLDQFHHCDSTSDQNNLFNCYYFNEKKFHEKVLSLKDSPICTNMNDICPFWRSEYSALSKAVKPCLYFNSSGTFIEIWSACSYSDPVFDAEHDLRSKIGPNLSKCAREALDKKSRAVQKTWDQYEFCKHNISLVLDSQYERLNSNCRGWIRFSEASWRMDKCFSATLKTFEKSAADANNLLKLCGQ